MQCGMTKLQTASCIVQKQLYIMISGCSMKSMHLTLGIINAMQRFFQAPCKRYKSKIRLKFFPKTFHSQISNFLKHKNYASPSA